ncbi:MAG: hypothetical protein ACJ74I_08800 [Gaiellaceae bacterium]
MLAGCGGKSATAPTTTGQETTQASTTKRARVSHAAPQLEALLPSMIDGHRLAKGSATGAVVLSGNNAFSQVLKGILGRAGKTPEDLTFANAQAPALGVEVGAFHVVGLAAPALRDAIVRSTRPNAPGLAVSSRRVGSRRVTKVVYPSGATLYLYPHGDVVFYVGTRDEMLAARILHRLG